MKHLSLAAVSCVCAMTLGCATPPTPRQDLPRSKVSKHDFDTTWAKVVAGIASANMPIKHIAKDSGLIVLERTGFSDADADCGRPGLEITLSKRADINIHFERQGPTVVNVNARYVSVRRLLDTPAYTVNCVSTGQIERFVLDMIE
jgi:hypothetical protein